MIDKRVVRTKKDLKNSLLILMENNQYETITAKNIVEHAGYNRGTFYLHFHGKEDVMNELIGDIFAGLTDSFRTPYRNHGQQNLMNVLAEDVLLFAYIYEHKAFFSLMVTSPFLSAFRDRVLAKFITIFEEDLHFLLQKNKEIDRELFVQFRAYGLYGLVMEWIKSEYAHSPVYMSKQLLKIFYYKLDELYFLE